VKGLVVNSPQNPLGKVFSEAWITRVVEFAERNEMHVLFDEIYAESLMPEVRHYSGLRLQSKYAHVIYGFAKDFGLSGFKTGVLYSTNQEVIGAAQKLAYFYTVSMQTQRTLAGLLGSPDLDRFFGLLRRVLNESCSRTRASLSGCGIQSTLPGGGIVLWLDLRSYLKQAGFKAERELFLDILNTCRVNISPGGAFHCPEPGWFRLCFTIPESHSQEGMKRLCRYFLSIPC
jgi:aspartate/methionine/tyrosine aminotransferase